MDSPGGSTDTRVKALAAFDRARDAFLAAFAAAPDESLTFVPPGDEYALGVLPIHLQDPIHHYLDVFEQMREADFGAIDLGSGPAAETRAQADAARHVYLTVQRPTGAERPQMLAALERAHHLVHKRMLELDEATFARQAPVVYAAGAAPFDTSAQAIVGWLTEHYTEHEVQTRTLLEQWRAQR